MRYMMAWCERPMGSPADYEAAQDRARALWDPLKWPDALIVTAAVSRLDGYGGYAFLETDDVHALHALVLTFPAYTFEIVPVMDFHESLKSKRDALEWRETYST
jgi:hypothetical protein